jgi:hypothetical protein
MPTETAIIVAGIAVIFAAFYTRNVRTPGASYFDAADSRK